MIDGKVGPYQVAYVKDKSEILYSKMFDKIEAALDFAHKSSSRWLLLQKVGHDKEDYAWKVLPYGAYKSLRLGVQVDKLRVVIIIALVIALAYFAGKIFSSPKKMMY